jgi:hypothetical protein
VRGGCGLCVIEFGQGGCGMVGMSLGKQEKLVVNLTSCCAQCGCMFGSGSADFDEIRCFVIVLIGVIYRRNYALRNK